jgi:hypothetical protein
VISSGVVSDFVLEIFSLKNLFLISFLSAREREKERGVQPRGRKKEKKNFTRMKVFLLSFFSQPTGLEKRIVFSLCLSVCVCLCARFTDFT